MNSECDQASKERFRGEPVQGPGCCAIGRLPASQLQFNKTNQILQGYNYGSMQDVSEGMP